VPERVEVGTSEGRLADDLKDLNPRRARPYVRRRWVVRRGVKAQIVVGADGRGRASRTGAKEYPET
jgi:hypothetical protein